MCLSPIKVRNRKIDYNCLNDKKWLFVPCGKCVQCREQYKQGYLLRAFYEYVGTISHGGCCFFYTLTYDNNHLPKVKISYDLLASKLPPKNSFVSRHVEYVKNSFEVPCFNKKQVQLFLRALDARINRSYHCGLRYFLTSEYGGKTKRPHYHVLFFIDKWVNKYRFRKLINDTWLYGFNKPGDNYGLVQNINAIKYVAKYVAKDIDCPVSIQSLDPVYKEKLKETFQNCSPFHLQSQGFGIHALACMSPCQRLIGSLCLPSESNTSLSDSILPTYLLRKLYYTQVKNKNGTNSYVINSAGKARAILLFKKNVESFNEELSELLAGRFPCSEEFTKEYAFFFTKLFDSKEVLPFNELFNTITNEDKKSFIDYVLILRGRSAIYPYHFDCDSVKLLDSFLTDSDPLPFVNSSSEILFDDCPEFRNYDKLLEVFHFVRNYKSYLNYKSAVLKYNAIQQQRYDSHKYKELNKLEVPNFLTYLNL